MASNIIVLCSFIRHQYLPAQAHCCWCLCFNLTVHHQCWYSVRSSIWPTKIDYKIETFQVTASYSITLYRKAIIHEARLLQRQRAIRGKAIQGYSRLSIVPIDVAYVTFYQHSIITQPVSTTVLDIPRLLCTSIPHLSSRWNCPGPCACAGPCASEPLCDTAVFCNWC